MSHVRGSLVMIKSSSLWDGWRFRFGDKAAKLLCRKAAVRQRLNISMQVFPSHV